MSDESGVRRFVERFALLLTEAGMARTPARVFACVLAEDSGRLTAGELAERLEVSPAAISGAVRYLTQAGRAGPRRASPASGATTTPSTRRLDRHVHAPGWRCCAAGRRRSARASSCSAPTGPPGRRLAETREFFAFMQAELPEMLRRWEEAAR